MKHEERLKNLLLQDVLVAGSSQEFMGRLDKLREKKSMESY